MSSVIEVPDWYRTVALVGVDITGEPVVVLLDSTGAIMAVMKGEYAGTLKNIAVDASGRVIMIPTDPADIWGNAISMGNAELAAVLSPSKRFDRRGNVIFFDDFEHGLSKCFTEAIGTLASVSLSTEEIKSGGFSAKLVGGSDSSRLASISYYLDKPPASKLGVQFSISVDDDLEQIEMDAYYYDGVKSHRASLLYDSVADSWEGYVPVLGWEDILTDIKLNASSYAFHTAKIVFDSANDKYVRALVSGQEVDISAWALETTVVATNPVLLVTLSLTSLVTKNAVGYVDNIVVTQNEP